MGRGTPSKSRNTAWGYNPIYITIKYMCIINYYLTLHMNDSILNESTEYTYK